MVNKIFLGEKAIRIGRLKIWLCEIEGCNEPKLSCGKKYCLRHSNKQNNSSGKTIDFLGRLKGDNFRFAFDEAFGILYCDLKIISGARETEKIK